MTDSDQTMTLHLGRGADRSNGTERPGPGRPSSDKHGPEKSSGPEPELPDRFWADDDAPADSDRSAAEPAAGLITLGYLRAAVRRSRIFILVMAAVGLLIGAGLLVVAPPAYEATSTLMLAHDTGEDAVSAQATDAVLAASDAVAERTMQALGLHDSLKKFEASYSVTIVTNSILTVVFRAPTSSTAVRDENALTTEFLKFRTAQLQNQQAGVLASLEQQITQANNHVAALARQITQLQGQTSTGETRVKIAVLQAQHTSAVSAATVLTESVRDNQAATQVTTTQIVKGSTVLNSATPIPHSHLKLPAEYVGGGLIGGLAIGVIIVIIRTLISDRLRRRDDIARVLGAPVRLSVAGAGVSRWRPGQRGLAAAGRRDLQRVVGFLRSEVSPRSRGSASLAVVPAGDPRTAAVCTVALAVARAKEGKRVMLADLAGGAAARLLGVTTPGVSKISADGAQLVVVVPEGDDVLPAGPLHPGGGLALADEETGPLAKELAAAHKSADLLLTLAVLDPAVGAEHLTTWTSKVVTLITAGQSSATRIQALGEMIRLAGLPLAAAVLIDADKTDESLGVPQAPDEGMRVPAGAAEGDFR
jgi:capsular polysaccharide biosynthesis protein